MRPTPDVKRRVLASLSHLPAPTRAESLRARARLLGCGLAGALVFFFVAGGVRLTSRPPALVALTSIGAMAIAVAGTWILLTRGRSVLGRPTSWLIASAIVFSVLFVAWRYGVSFVYGHTRIWPERPGFRCLGLGVATGAPLLLAVLVSWRRTVPVSPVSMGVAFGAGAGLGSGLLVDLYCPVSYLPHLMLGHLLPIVILAAIGGALGARMLGIRWRPSIHEGEEGKRHLPGKQDPGRE